MSVWLGFAKAQGIGKKVAVVKTLVEADDISSAIVQGVEMIATIKELSKVDMAILHVLSGAGTWNGSGYLQVLAQAINYSANTFAFTLATAESGLGLSTVSISGDAFSGVIRLRALIIGEPAVGGLKL